MKKILIPENKGDLKVISDMVDQACECESGDRKKNTSMEAVVLHPNLDPSSKWAKWCVVDNRDHQCFTEDFATLDGALIYATDLRTTTERQDRWDLDGNFAVELEPYLTGKKLECDAAATDPLERWGGEDHDELAELFAEAIVRNVNKKHVVRYLTEDHDNGDGTYETDLLVEMTYTNATGAMGEIDHALESMNGRDWRIACDKFLAKTIRGLGGEPDKFNWPVPDARVTLDYYEDENDVVKTATVVWAVDEATWMACKPKPKPEETHDDAWDEEMPVTEMCPHCNHDVTIEWNVKRYGYKAFCPHCGKELMLCDECRHSEDNPDGKCTNPCFRKEKPKCPVNADTWCSITRRPCTFAGPCDKCGTYSKSSKEDKK